MRYGDPNIVRVTTSGIDLEDYRTVVQIVRTHLDELITVDMTEIDVYVQFGVRLTQTDIF